MLNKNDFRYNSEHVIARRVDDVLYLGISSYGAMHLGAIHFIDPARVGTVLKAGETMVALESSKEEYLVPMPINGKVVEINADLMDDTFALSLDPFNNWIIAIIPDNMADYDNMMNCTNYESTL